MRYDQNWSFYNPIQIIFGPASINGLPSLVPFNKLLIITSPGFTKRGLTKKLCLLLKDKDIEILDNVQPNPDIKTMELYWKEFQKQGFQCLIGVGGGSVLDTTKTLSCLLGIDDLDFCLRTYLDGKIPFPNKHSPLTTITVPTAAGTGSEVTPFSTIWDVENQEKYSLTVPNFYPSVALLDPELSLTLPKEITIITALDALSHALESVWNHHANPITLHYASYAIDIILTTLPLLLERPNELNYRSKMMIASLFGGLCISSTRTALAHSMSYPISISLMVPHGLACGFALPELLKFNSKNDDGRFNMLAQSLGYNTINDVKKSIDSMYDFINIKKLMAKYKMNVSNLLNLVPKMFSSERFGNNLRLADIEDVKNILIMSCEI